MTEVTRIACPGCRTLLRFAPEALDFPANCADCDCRFSVGVYIKLACPQCHCGSKIRESYKGQRVRCVRCHHNFQADEGIPPGAGGLLLVARMLDTDLPEPPETIQPFLGHAREERDRQLGLAPPEPSPTSEANRELEAERLKAAEAIADRDRLARETDLFKSILTRLVATPGSPNLDQLLAPPAEPTPSADLERSQATIRQLQESLEHARIETRQAIERSNDLEARQAMVLRSLQEAEQKAAQRDQALEAIHREKTTLETTSDRLKAAVNSAQAGAAEALDQVEALARRLTASESSMTSELERGFHRELVIETLRAEIAAIRQLETARTEDQAGLDSALAQVEERFREERHALLDEIERMRLDAEEVAERTREQLDRSREERDASAALASQWQASTAEAEARHQDELARFTAEVNHRQQARTALLDENQKLAGQLAQGQVETEKVRLDAEQARNQAKLAHQDAEVARAEVQQARLEADRVKVQAEKARAEAEQVRIEAQQARTEADRSQLEARQAATETERSRSEAEHARIDAHQTRLEIERIKAEVQKAQIEAEKAEIQLERVLADARQTQAEADGYRLEAEHARIDAHQARTEAEQIKAEVQQVRLEAEQVHPEIERVRDEVRQAQAEADRHRLEAEHAKIDAHQTRLKMELIQAEAQKARLEADKAGTEIERVQAQVQQAHVEAERLRLEAEHARIDAHQARTESDQRKLEVEQVRLEAREVKLEAEQAQAEVRRIRAQAEEPLAENERLADLVDRLLGDSQQMTEDADRLIAENRRISAELAGFQGIRKENERLTRSSGDSEQLRLEIERLSTANDQAQLRQAELAGELERSKTEFQKIANVNDRLADTVQRLLSEKMAKAEAAASSNGIRAIGQPTQPLPAMTQRDLERARELATLEAVANHKPFMPPAIPDPRPNKANLVWQMVNPIVAGAGTPPTVAETKEEATERLLDLAFTQLYGDNADKERNNAKVIKKPQ